MRALTINPSAASPAGGRFNRVVRHWMAGLTLAAACAMSSAPARAGICLPSTEIAPRTVDSQTAASSHSVHSFVDTAELDALASNHPAGVDPLSMDPMTRGLLLSDYSPKSSIWTIADSTKAVSDALPKPSDAPPLLIPLPTAASAGAWGLLAVAFLLAARRTLRRRLFA